MRPTLNLITLGCSKNTVDSEHLLGSLSDTYTVLHEENVVADVVMINTCGFINDAKEESVNTILEFAAYKSEGKVQLLIVFGCLSKRYKEELAEEIPEVDHWFGVDEHAELVALLVSNKTIASKDKRYLTTPSHYAYLKIAEGCDRGCAFCIIPDIRGAYKSVDEKKLVNEAKELVKGGVKELILIAQDLSYYGKDKIDNKSNLPDLIRQLLAEDESLPWLRLHYLYPDMVNAELLNLIAREERVCNYLDIPFQHSTDKMLKTMRRGHTEKDLRKMIHLAREIIPNLAIRTTFLVGHPGETEEDFDALCEFIKEMEFDRLGVFTYSHEEGTYASMHYKDEIPEETKLDRLETIMQLQEGVSLEKNKKKIGTHLSVLIDRVEGDYYIGRSAHDSPEVDNEVLIHSDSNLAVGSFYQVLITDAEPHDLYGTV